MNFLIECLICEKVFNEPVLLPCCHTICKTHVITDNNHVKEISCPTCNESYEIPKNGFPANILAENLIKFKFDRLDLGAEHSTAVKSGKNLKKVLDELKRLRDTPDLEISQSIGEIRNKIDLKREEAKKKIDDDAMELIQELDEYEAKCKREFSIHKYSTDAQCLNDELKLVQEEINSWIKALNK